MSSPFGAMDDFGSWFHRRCLSNPACKTGFKLASSARSSPSHSSIIFTKFFEQIMGVVADRAMPPDDNCTVNNGKFLWRMPSRVVVVQIHVRQIDLA